MSRSESKDGKRWRDYLLLCPAGDILLEISNIVLAFQ